MDVFEDFIKSTEDTLNVKKDKIERNINFGFSFERITVYYVKKEVTPNSPFTIASMSQYPRSSIILVWEEFDRIDMEDEHEFALYHEIGHYYDENFTINNFFKFILDKDKKLINIENLNKDLYIPHSLEREKFADEFAANKISFKSAYKFFHNNIMRLENSLYRMNKKQKEESMIKIEMLKKREEHLRKIESNNVN